MFGREAALGGTQIFASGSVRMRPSEALRHHMELGSTGALSIVDTDGAYISVFLMQGEILSAESVWDGAGLVKRLVNGHHVSSEKGVELVRRLGHAAQVGDVLFGTVPDDVVMELYACRFQENLARFMLSDAVPEFVEKESIHVENVQVGHDSYELLSQLGAILERVRYLMQPDLSILLSLGEEPPATAQQARLLEALPSSGVVADWVEVSPFEPIFTLVCIEELLELGALEEFSSLDDLSDKTEKIPVVEDSPTPAEPVEEPMVVDGPVIVDEEMTMFADNEFARGRSGDGQFTVSRDLLDTVDLSGLSLLDHEPPEDELILEMEEGDQDAVSGAVTLSFGSPPLTSEEAITKIEVTNEVLRQICLALDEELGSGTGQASIQLLVESARTDFVPLFDRLEAARDGALRTERMILNIEKRPDQERRRLLNRAMRDIIERGFTLAVERISEERFEDMLEGIAGYQMRLGL